jgi:hypothetical protein
MWDNYLGGTFPPGDYVNYYNHQRIHAALGYLTADEFAAATVTLVAA